MALPEIGSRKRYRSNCDDEVSEFTPLSKRINNLHINNGSITKNFEPKTEGHREIIVNNERHEYGGRGMDGGESSNAQHWLPLSHYSPDLSPSQNPFYYESNRLLFELFVERSQRTQGSSSNQSNHY